MGQCFFWFKRRPSDGTNDGTVKMYSLLLFNFNMLYGKLDGHPIRHRKGLSFYKGTIHHGYMRIGFFLISLPVKDNRSRSRISHP